MTAPVASTQTASLIGTAVSNALGGTFGGSLGGSLGGGGGVSAPGPLSLNSAEAEAAPKLALASGANAKTMPAGTYFNTRETGKAGGGMPAKLGVWAQGTWVNVDKTEAGLVMSGNVYNVVGGLDYKFTDRILGGLAVGGEWTRMDTKFNGGTYDGDGITVAPYIGVTLTPHWGWDLSVGHTWLNYDVSSLPTGASTKTTGSFDAGRWFGATNVTGNYSVNRWLLSPKVGVMYLKEVQDSYKDSTGATNAETDILFGRATGGGKVGYAFETFAPYVKVMGEWDFKKPSAVLKSNGQMSAVDDGGGTAAVGVDLFKGPVSGTVEGAYNSIGRTSLNVWQTTARVRYQF